MSVTHDTPDRVPPERRAPWEREVTPGPQGHLENRVDLVPLERREPRGEPAVREGLATRGLGLFSNVGGTALPEDALNIIVLLKCWGWGGDGCQAGVKAGRVCGCPGVGI